MQQLVRDDDVALAELFCRYGETVKRCLTRFAMELSVAETEELCQEVFWTVYTSAARYVEQEHFRSWLLGIAVKKAKIWRRNHWIRLKLLSRNGDPGTAMALPLNIQVDVQLELRQEVKRVLNALPKSQQEVLLLHAVDGFSGVEIAKMLNVKEAVVWTRLHRARQRIAEMTRRTRREMAYQGGT